MSVDFHLFDHANIHQLEWPNSEEAKQAKALLLRMLQEGVQAFIRNVKTKLYLMQVNNTLIPITIYTKEYNHSSAIL